MTKEKRYGLGLEAGLKEMAAPKLRYQPCDPKRYRPAIGLIGCGGITLLHLRAYKAAGYNVVAVCDIDPARAESRRKEFFPNAVVYTDYCELLQRDDIEVVDIATHPRERVGLIRAALNARKHVLSQKPFVLDLTTGQRLVELAEKKGRRLAVNQNGRWAPHFSYIRQAITAGAIGEVLTIHCSSHWNHDWIAGTPFDKVRHIILYDFAIHWFDLVVCWMGKARARRVYASVAKAAGQRARPGLLGQVLIEYPGAQVSLVFDGFTKFGHQDRTCIVGSEGTIASVGPSITEQKVTLYNSRGYCSPQLIGSWFPDGFHGAMGELLCAIEEKRQPFNNAADNLRGLALCFAAARSADTGKPQIPGRVRAITI